jgi:hypothetical protein
LVGGHGDGGKVKMTKIIEAYYVICFMFYMGIAVAIGMTHGDGE